MVGDFSVCSLLHVRCMKASYYYFRLNCALVNAALAAYQARRGGERLSLRAG